MTKVVNTLTCPQVFCGLTEEIKMLITSDYGKVLIELDNQREKEVFQMILKDANLNEIRDDVRTEAYQLWQKLTDEVK